MGRVKNTIKSSDLWFGDNYEVTTNSANRITGIIYMFLGYEEPGEVILTHRAYESKEDANTAFKEYLDSQKSISSMMELR